MLLVLGKLCPKDAIHEYSIVVVEELMVVVVFVGIIKVVPRVVATRCTQGKSIEEVACIGMNLKYHWPNGYSSNTVKHKLKRMQVDTTL